MSILQDFLDWLESSPSDYSEPLFSGPHKVLTRDAVLKMIRNPKNQVSVKRRADGELWEGWDYDPREVYYWVHIKNEDQKEWWVYAVGICHASCSDAGPFDDVFRYWIACDNQQYVIDFGMTRRARKALGFE